MTKKSLIPAGIALTASVLLMGLVMRTPITTLPLMLTQLSAELHLPAGQLGILTTIPLIMFLLISNFASKTIALIGLKKAVALSVATILIGSLLRLIVTMPTMVMGTILIGFGIAHLNVFMPSFVAAYFPLKVGLYTSMYSLTIMVGSAVFSLLTAPMTLLFGWHSVMWLIAILVLAVLAVWLYTSRLVPEKIGPRRQQTNAKTPSAKPMWTNWRAWPFLVAFGMQATINYTAIAWLPALMTYHHVTSGQISLIMFLYSFIGVPVSIIVPNILVHMHHRGLVTVILIAGILALVGCGLLFYQGTSSFAYWITTGLLVGFTPAFFFLYCMTMFAHKTDTPVETANLSGMAQAGGYFISAFGPVLYGHAFTINPTGNLQNVLFLIMIIIMVVASIKMALTKHLHQ